MLSPDISSTIVRSCSKDIWSDMRALSFVAFLLLATSCSPVSKGRITKSLLETELKFQDQTGLVIYDVKKNRTILEFNADKYFTPASNTKILTLLAGLETLGDSVPALRYIERPDSVIIWPCGDPSFLNPSCFNSNVVYDFLRSRQKPIYVSLAHFKPQPFGPGWAWDDYNDDYSQERSAFPIYGNSIQVLPLPDQILILPTYFRKFMNRGPAQEKVKVVRDLTTNNFTWFPGTKKTFDDILIPFKTDTKLLTELLADTLHRPVKIIRKEMDSGARTLFSTPSDSLYSVMMKESDNFIAEQILLMCSGVMSDTLDGDIAIRRMQQTKFKWYPDKVVWKDGSGLSRYNLFTPRTILRVWQEINSKVPAQRLFSLLATGGEVGTLKKWYKSEKPYLFGKTGTLSNNHSLSGFLKTKKGNTLIFAFMNANYVSPLNEVRQNMERILNLYYENY
jgi:serine-type D-Ala-D-Ala carboxypeptidase/endopeptidase (penicillin-binding protein 4)